ncbi:MAG: putative DNA binding domain-containing protein [Gammaproteobacteria bacterium]|nr:putative DNA binding domain-containing protein [Gammaproteobacteria bacterium]
MTEAELARRIRLGEDSGLELKSVDVERGRVNAPDKRDLADELSAFANSRGGTLLLGVEDGTRRILGIPLDELDAVETWVRDLCNDSIRPALDAHILKLELTDEKGQPVPLLRIDVERSLHVHEGPHGYFRRIGSSKRKVPPEALARLFQERSQSRVIRFDESPVPNTTRDDLNYALTQRFLRGDAAEPASGGETHDDAAAEDALLRKIRILTSNDDGAARLTLSGTLLCTESPQNWLPQAYIQAVSYVGERTDAEYQSDARDILGPIDQQVAEALHFVRRNMLVRAKKQTARSELPQFSERAVFEALVNAVAHRDYSMAGARVRLRLFGDRLELLVPGGLVNTLTPDSLHLRQANRNELIVSLLARCEAPTGLGRTRLMDRRGDGVPIIRNECEALSGRMPEYSLIDEEELRLTIWAAA